MFATGFNAVMAGTGSPSTVVSIEIRLRRLRKNMREPPVSNNLSSRSEDFFFFTSVQLDAQFRNTQCDVDSVRFSGRLQTATSRYVWKVEQKNQCSLSASLSWALQECQCIASFFDGPPRSTERQVFRDIWWVHQTRSLSDAVTKTLVLGILLLGHVSAHAVHAAATIFSTFVLFVVCVLAWTASETFFLDHRLYTG